MKCWHSYAIKCVSLVGVLDVLHHICQRILGLVKLFLESLQSPQFRQQVEAFSYVLRTGQIDLSQFGIDPSKYNFTVASFLEALDDAVVKTPEIGNDSLLKLLIF